MFIAVTNNHGWGKGKSREEALAIALQNSLHRMCTEARVWKCVKNAYVNGIGQVFGVIGEHVEYTRKMAQRSTWKIKKG